MNKTAPSAILFLQIATVCVFAGRAWQQLFFDAPWRELLWDDGWMKGILENLSSLTWKEYVSQSDAWIGKFIFANGVFLTFCAAVAAFVHRLPHFFRIFLWLGAANLCLLALLYLKESFFHAGQFFEYSLQFGAPVFFWLALRKGRISERLVFWMKIAIAATFICHGLYAVGFYPRPGVFLSMTMHILGVDEASAILFLKIAGALDFVVAFGIFLPEKWSKPMLIYVAVWGLVTALARVLGNFYWQFPWQSLHQNLFETVFRLPHFLVPLGLLALSGRRKIFNFPSP